MSARVLMVQGTASSAGKSTLVTALCRIFRQDGLRVTPFKAQNMALNSFVTADGGELGRSQAVQAEAAGAEMSVDMNPILLKPETDARCQVIVRGKPFATLSVGQYYDYKGILWPIVVEAMERLRSRYDLMVIEGAGSPAEVNLREQDIVNMRVALAADAPVLLVADIDRGGVFASLVGTLELLESQERDLVKALVINKFRGDLSLFSSGVQFLERRTGIPVAGVIPYFRDISIAQEDSVSLEGQPWPNKARALLDVAVIHFPHIANFDDIDPLVAEPEVRLRLVSTAEELGQPDLVVLPGTKTTIADLEYLRRTRLADRVVSLAGDGIPIIGICGGYQMLGRRLLDPLGVESDVPEAVGLGLLPVDTTFVGEKETRRAHGRIVTARGLLSLAQGQEVEGYEIHMGHTKGRVEPAITIHEQSGDLVTIPEGAVSENGLVLGTYLHGLFDSQGLRLALLRWLAQRKGVDLQGVGGRLDKGREYDRLAALVRPSLNMRLIYKLVGLGGLS